MRILHVSQPVDAGVPRVVLDLVAEQLARGWEVWVACPPSGWLTSAAERAGAQVVPWEATRTPGRRLLKEMVTLRSTMARVDPSVVHLHSAKAGLAGRLVVRGRRPTLFQPHAWSFLAVGGVVGAASLLWERWASRWTDVVIAVSAAEADRGSAAGVSSPMVVAPNGVDTRAWSPGDRTEARARLELGDGPLAVCAGRLSPQKGQDALLAVWPEIRARVPGARLVLVGDGPLHDSLERSAAESPGVQLAGGTFDVRPWYAAADVVVVPSRWEGMALVPLEAMASGRSVVATDVDGISESLGADTGAVVPVGDGAALVDAIARRLADPVLCDREGSAGRQRVLSHSDVRRCAAVAGDAAEAVERSFAARTSTGPTSPPNDPGRRPSRRSAH